MWAEIGRENDSQKSETCSFVEEIKGGRKRERRRKDEKGDKFVFSFFLDFFRLYYCSLFIIYVSAMWWNAVKENFPSSSICVAFSLDFLNSEQFK